MHYRDHSRHGVDQSFAPARILAKSESQCMSKTIAIIQSNYIPWKGYFDIIDASDEFIVYDDMQYTRRDWRNRNLIKTSSGPKWLTVPVAVKGKFDQRICDTKIADKSWAELHFKTIQHAYSRTPFFREYANWLESLYTEAAAMEYLSEVNLLFLKAICSQLGITTEIRCSTELEIHGDRSERLLNICKTLRADHYISGPAASCYLDLELFNSAGVEVSFFDYSNYQEYDQVYPPFSHQVSALDLLFHAGGNAIDLVRNRTAQAVTDAIKNSSKS